jgi:simple sugar transport system ATP-binding protein
MSDIASVHPRLEARGVAKRFGGVQALDGVSLKIAPGEVLCLAGENGCGKSTFSKIVSGVVSLDEGEVLLDGEPLAGKNPMERMTRGVHVIYQDFSLFPNLSVAENIFLVRQACEGQHLVDRRSGRIAAADALRSIGVAIDLDELVEHLTVGEKQCVAIARAIGQNARLVIMDEPTTALTTHEIERLLDIVRKLASEGVSFIFVSHKLEEVLDVSDRIVVLRNGRKTLDGPSENMNAAEITVAMIGSELPSPPARKNPADGTSTPLLRLKGLSSDGRFSGVDLDLRRGEIIGLSGKLGSGRTALALALFGAEPVTAGTIEMDGEAVRMSSIPDAIAKRIAYVPEDRLTEGLFLERSIKENIALRSFDRLRDRFGFLDGAKIAAEASRWIADLTIKAPNPDLPARSLSGGNQQRIVLAKWLATDPRILILNRPTVGVDVGAKYALHATIARVADEGTAVIVISDDYPELVALCSRILVMDQGRVVDEVTPLLPPRPHLPASATELRP